MASILDNIRALVTPAMLSEAATLTGASESAVGKGLGAAIPGILAALANRSDDGGFMKQLGNLALGSSDSDPLAAARAFMTPSNAAIDTTTPMGNWLSGLFGNNFSSVTNALAQYSGVRSASAASLLSIGASYVLGYLGRLMRSDRLDANGLAQRLRAEKADYMAALPAGFNMPGFVRDVPPRRYDTAVAVPERRAGSWAVPLLLSALALGTLAWWANHNRVERSIARVTDSTMKTVGTSGVRISEMQTRALPGNINISIPKGSMEDNLASYAERPSAGSNSFTFDRISFMTGSSSLTDESREQIENVAAILRAYPSMHVTVGGHSDNVGSSSANLALSTARAESVADALTRAGVTANRVHPEGFGDAKPIADNSTESGRAQNRRVTLDVIER
jgi:OOP family OmpA-OmpF porin